MMIPFTPHLAYESLELLGCKTSDIWPKIKGDIIKEIKFRSAGKWQNWGHTYNEKRFK